MLICNTKCTAHVLPFHIDIKRTDMNSAHHKANLSLFQPARCDIACIRLCILAMRLQGSAAEQLFRVLISREKIQTSVFLQGASPF